MLAKSVILAAVSTALAAAGAVAISVGSTPHLPAPAPLPPKSQDRKVPVVDEAPPTTTRPTAGQGISAQGSSAVLGPPPALPPATIAIPALGVTASIGMASLSNGVLTPPRVPTEVGMWPSSARLGSSTGEVTITGHINWAGMPPFAFGRLADLRVGDAIYTTDHAGAERTWVVASVLSRPKSEPVDAAAFKGTTGPSELALITCGGAYDPYDHNYLSNVYVFAVPLAP